MTAAHVRAHVRAHDRTSCCRSCPAGVAHAAHHDRLLRVDVDVEEVLALLEVAVTWHELDYSDHPVLGPSAWVTFADAHDWTDRDRAERVFGLALDIVGRTPLEPPRPAMARVMTLVRD
ncbi:hypothetical protein WEH80_20030 [Actinomycetes bacterium KLBMP 9759]